MPLRKDIAHMDDAVADLESWEKSVIASVFYRHGQEPEHIPLNQIKNCLSAGGGLLWTGLCEPSEDLLRQVGAALNFPRKVLEELIEPHRRPKIIEYKGLVLIVAITVEIDTLRPAFGDTQILIGKGFLLTIRRGASQTHRVLRERLEDSPEFLDRGSDYVAAALLDLLVDRYVEALTRLEAGVEGVEQRFLLRGFHEGDVRMLYRQRRDLLRIHTAVAPLAEICRRLSRIEMHNIDVDSRASFSEVADRVLRVNEFINSLREALAFAFEASLMIGQTQQTDTTRRLAAWGAILAVPTAVAGIYGMNVKVMPELNWTYGYPLVMALTFAACGILYWRFKKAKWL
jgi:magnesium transporter